MPLRSAGFCTLWLLAGCAGHPDSHVEQAPQVEQAKIVPPAASPALPHGTILAMRPVPAQPASPARVLLASLGTKDAVVAGQIFEFIVRTDGGSTISVVQPQMNRLHTGARVSILRGTETRIDAPPAD